MSKIFDEKEVSSNFYDHFSVDVRVPTDVKNLTKCVDEKGNEYALKVINKVRFKSQLKQIKEMVLTWRKLDHKNIIKLHDVFEDDVNINLVLDTHIFSNTLIQVLENKKKSDDEAEIAKSVMNKVFEKDIFRGENKNDNNIDKHEKDNINIQKLFKDMANSLYYLSISQPNLHYGGVNLTNFYYNNDQVKMVFFQLSSHDYSFLPIFLTPQSNSSSLIFKDEITFFAPEVFKGQISKVSDMWSLGICLFYMLFGYYPYSQNNFESLKGSKLDDELEKTMTFLSVAREGRGPWIPKDIAISDSCKDLLIKLLCFDPTFRYTIEDVVNHSWLQNDSQHSFQAPYVLHGLRTFKADHESVRGCLCEYFSNNMDDIQIDSIRRTFYNLDTDRDNQISIDELKNGLQNLHNKEHNLISEEMRLKMINDVNNIIKECDSNQDQFLDLNEILTAASYRYLSSNQQRLRHLFNQLDDNHNGSNIQSGFKPLLILGQNIINTLDIALNEGEKSSTCSNPIIIKEGVNNELDQLRQLIHNNQEWLDQYQQSQQSLLKTSLKIGYSHTFGYYIGLTKKNSQKLNEKQLIPDSYQKKQTLVTEDRYLTPELQERSNQIINAEQSAKELEEKIINQLQEEINRLSSLIGVASEDIAILDILCGFAELALSEHYCCPIMSEDRNLFIWNGRHPVVEQLLNKYEGSEYISNNTFLGYEKQQNYQIDQILDDDLEMNLINPKNSCSPLPPEIPDIMVLTGPNAAGKSCYLKQVAIIQIMAQIGCFVPASHCKLGLCDQIFTRVGAVDDISLGKSTFVVEMGEVSNILQKATNKSLILFDEVGRGTSTSDGLAIAQSVIEYTATKLHSRCIFATHYHQMNSLSDKLKNVKNYRLNVNEVGGKLLFEHRIYEGGADRSYGIEVAKLTGLPNEVVERAKSIVNYSS